MAKSKKKKHKGAKQNSGGEAKKGAEKRRTSGAKLADQQDHKRGNIGPSGQGSHRGRERKSGQSRASGGFANP